MSDWSVRFLGILLVATFFLGVAPSAFAGAPTTDGDSCGVFVGASRTFFLANVNTTGATVAVAATFGPGGSALDPISNDFDGNQTDTFGVYDHVAGFFYLNNSNASTPADVTVRFGAKDRQSPANPLVGVSGDFNGSGSAGIGLYDPDSSFFHLQFTPANGGQVDASFKLGNGGQGLLPIVGDFNIDGRDTVGVYDQVSGRFTFKAANTAGAATTTIRFGGKGTTNLPVAGDFNDDGTDTMGLYVPSARTFLLGDANVDGGGSITTFKFGGSDASIVPICGDFDGV